MQLKKQLKTDNLYAPTQQKPPETGEMYLVNPSIEEFRTTFFNDKNHSVEVVLAPLETRAFPRSIGETVLKHLMNFVLNQGGFSYKTDVNLELAKIREKCVTYE